MAYLFIMWTTDQKQLRNLPNKAEECSILTSLICIVCYFHKCFLFAKLNGMVQNVEIVSWKSQTKALNKSETGIVLIWIVLKVAVSCLMTILMNMAIWRSFYWTRKPDHPWEFANLSISACLSYAFTQWMENVPDLVFLYLHLTNSIIFKLVNNFFMTVAEILIASNIKYEYNWNILTP